MKKLTILIFLFAALILGCETENKIIPGSQGDDRVLTSVSTVNVVHSDTANINKTIRFRTILDAGYPCFTFSHFAVEREGGEVFITPMAYKSFSGCDYFESRIERVYIFEPEGTGRFLFHFWQSDGEYYHFMLDVVDSSQIEK